MNRMPNTDIAVWGLFLGGDVAKEARETCEEIERLRTDAARTAELASRARNWQKTLSAYDGADMPASDAWEAFEIVHALARLGDK